MNVLQDIASNIKNAGCTETGRYELTCNKDICAFAMAGKTSKDSISPKHHMVDVAKNDHPCTYLIMYLDLQRRQQESFHGSSNRSRTELPKWTLSNKLEKQIQMELRIRAASV